MERKVQHALKTFRCVIYKGVYIQGCSCINEKILIN